jgi:hypothetical protein
MGAGLNGPGAETQYATTPFAIYEDPVEADQEDTHGAVESTEETQVADESTTE